jgi:hypothetical protein
MILRPGGQRGGDGFHSARVDGRQVPHPPPDLPLEGGGDELPRPGGGLFMGGKGTLSSAAVLGGGGFEAFIA